MRNGSGYNDSTADKAMMNIAEEVRRIPYEDVDTRANKLIKTLKTVADLAGFEFAVRISIRDRKTGKLYR